MVMTDACAAVSFLHDRSPVILPPDEWAQWLYGDPAEALALCRPWPGDLTVEHTAEPWVRKR